MKRFFLLAGLLICSTVIDTDTARAAGLSEMGDMAQEQAQEKLELEDMRNEMKDIKGQVKDAMGAMSQLTSGANADMARQLGSGQNPVQEVHLFAGESVFDAGNKKTSKILTYNGKMPGPEIHLREGDPARIVLHNNLKTPTSMHFHGMILPQKVDGLPRAGSATTAPERFLKPDETFVYQFIAGAPGTYFYHPQIIHQDQRFKGMFGAIIVHPRLRTKEVNKEMVLFLSRQETGAPGTGENVYLINDKTAPFAPPLNVLNGERVRLHVINNMDEAVPLHLSGHRFEVIAQNGSDAMEPHITRDTITVNAADRVDLEFAANNPGVWSLASELPKQNANPRFPGGLAMVVRYTEVSAPQAK